MAVPIKTPTPTPLIASFDIRQPARAPIEASEASPEALARRVTDVLKERASGGDSFNSLLCATLKALKGENPNTFTSLLQSCTYLIDSGSHGRMKTIKKRDVANNRRDFPADVEAVDNGTGEALLRRSETDLLEKRGLDIDTMMDKRQDEGFNSLLAPL